MNSLWKFALLACLLIGAVVADNHGGDHDETTGGADAEKTCATECLVPKGLPTGEGATYTKEVCDKVKGYLDCLKTNAACKDDASAKTILDSMKDTADECMKVTGKGAASFMTASVVLTGLAVLVARW